jgi:sugar phosphate isomerase/epimerase
MSMKGFGRAPALSAEVFSTLSGRAAIDRVRQIGYSAIGIPAWRRDFAPDSLGDSGARDLAAYLGKNGLSVSWLSAGRKGRFTVSAALEEDVERIRRICALSMRLRSPYMPSVAVTATVGPLGAKDSPAANNAREALAAVAVGADASGAVVALAASQGEDALVDELIAGFPDAPLGRWIDPGALLFAGKDPVEAAMTSTRLAAVRASDSTGEETNLAPGEGRVAWRDFLAALGSRDYYGYATVEFAPRGSDTERATRALEVLRRGSV